MPPEGLPRPEEMWSGAVADASDDSHPIIERTEEFEGRVWSVVRDRVGFGHHEATRDVIIHPGAVAVIAVDDGDRILLIRQYRHPVAMYMFEPPAGLLDAAGELPLETARRELAEEAGVRASQWNVLVDLFNSPGGSSEAIRVFLARGLESLPGGRPHTGEAEEAHLPQAWVPLVEAVDLVLHGRVGSPSAVAGILALAALPTRKEGDLRPANDPWNARAWLEANSRVRRV